MALTESASTSSFLETFETAVGAIPNDPALAAIEIVTTDVRPGRTIGLTVLIDLVGGVDIESCERVAAYINAALDAFPDQMYTLEVSSAGLERPLVRPDDYTRFAGKNAKVITTLAINNAKTHRGVLAGMIGDDVILRTGAKNDIDFPIPIAAIKSANLEYDPRADLQRAKREKQSKA
jgi:ribosome maturation factor RimP